MILYLKSKPHQFMPMRYIFLLFWTLLFLFGCKGEPHNLESITITPADSTTGTGKFINFTATGKFADDEEDDLTDSVTWTTKFADGSSDSAVAFSSIIKGELYTGSSAAIYRIYAAIKNTDASTTSTATTTETIIGATKLTIQ